jgi:hypothetical protein
VPEIETLLLANHAEVVNGLLYVHGGGWSHHWRAVTAGAPTAPSQIAVAATFLLDPTERGGAQPFSIAIRDEAGEEVVRADGSFEVGRDEPRTRTPERRRLAFAANIGVAFPHEGRYTVTAEAMGNPPAVVEFWVHDGPPGAGSAPAPGGDAPAPPAGTGGYI